MALVVRSRDYVNGDSLPADYYDADLDEIVAGVNNIVNAQVANNAAIAESKIAFSGTAGQYAQSGGDGTITWTTVTVNRAYTWGILGTLGTGDEQGMKYIVPQNMTVTNLRAKTDSGSCNVRIRANNTNITASSAVTSTAGNITSFDSTSLTAGQVVTLDIVSVNNASGLYVTLEALQS